MKSSDLSWRYMKKTAAFIFVFSLMLVTLLHNAWASENSPKSISGSELMQLIVNDQAPMIIDVRSLREYKSGHIPGAIHIPFRSNFARIEEIMDDYKRLIIVYCAYGPRASWALRNMRRAGFENAIPMTGHISKWKKLKLPLIK